MPYTCNYLSPLGGMTIAADDDYLTGLWFDRQNHFPKELPAPCRAETHPVLRMTCGWLDAYFRGECPAFTPPLRLYGTPFRKDVWRILLQIPYGETTTYGAIAAQIARQKGLRTLSAQAVGGAVGCNPVSIVVPCHRVVGRNGSLTGYAGGLDRKEALLALERVGGLR